MPTAAKFGMPFIVCVRRHGKESILRQFEKRLTNDAASEQKTALGEIFRIAALRLDQRVTAPDRLKVHGHLSTHVLDTHGGHPAAGVAIELCEVAASGATRLIKRAVTNADGRTDQPLLSGAPVPIATYELRFAVSDYFARQGAPLADPPFLGIVPIRFAVAEPEGRYHVPLSVTPLTEGAERNANSCPGRGAARSDALQNRDRHERCVWNDPGRDAALALRRVRDTSPFHRPQKCTTVAAAPAPVRCLTREVLPVATTRPLSEILPKEMTELKVRPIFTLLLEVQPAINVGKTPGVDRRVGVITGGRFEGERLRGTLLPGGSDWQAIRPGDGAWLLNVRIVLKTDDDAIIGMSYPGLRHGPKEVLDRIARGEVVKATDYYLRISATFETASEKYGWLNNIISVGVGHRLPEGPIYQMFEVL